MLWLKTWPLLGAYKFRSRLDVATIRAQGARGRARHAGGMCNTQIHEWVGQRTGTKHPVVCRVLKTSACGTCCWVRRERKCILHRGLRATDIKSADGHTATGSTGAHARAQHTLLSNATTIHTLRVRGTHCCCLLTAAVTAATATRRNQEQRTNPSICQTAVPTARCYIQNNFPARLPRGIENLETKKGV